MLQPSVLRTFCVAVECESFSETARRLGYTTSAVSQQMGRLEKTLGRPLFERFAQSLTATAEARALAARAGLLLQDVAAFEADARAVLSGQPQLSIASFPSAGPLLSRALATLVSEVPDVDIQLSDVSDAKVEQAASGEIDLVVNCQYSNARTSLRRGLRRRTILSERLHVLYPTSRARAGELAELSDATWIAPPPGTRADRCLLRLCDAAGFEPSVRLRSSDYSVVCRLVATGLGVALVPDLGKVVHSGVRTLTLAPEQVHRDVCVESRRDNPNPLVAQFSAILAATALEMRGVGELRLNVGPEDSHPAKFIPSGR